MITDTAPSPMQRISARITVLLACAPAAHGQSLPGVGAIPFPIDLNAPLADPGGVIGSTAAMGTGAVFGLGHTARCPLGGCRTAVVARGRDAATKRRIARRKHERAL
jgi:hypothetical protein